MRKSVARQKRRVRMTMAERHTSGKHADYPRHGCVYCEVSLRMNRQIDEARAAFAATRPAVRPGREHWDGPGQVDAKFSSPEGGVMRLEVTCDYAYLTKRIPEHMQGPFWDVVWGMVFDRWQGESR